MSRYLLFIVLVSIGQFSVAQQQVSARLVDQQSGAGVAFANIRAFDFPEVGAVSDKNGQFQLVFPDGVETLRCLVSASSYFPKTIEISSSPGNQIFELEERIIELEEVVVLPQKEVEFNWDEDIEGLKLYGSETDGGDFVPMMMELKSSGELHGNAYRIKKSMKINEVGFHFYLRNGYSQRLFLRIFQTDDKPKPSQHQPLDGLKELTKQTILLDNLTDGFNKIDLSAEELYVNPGYLIIAFTADLTNVQHQKLTIFQENKKGKDVLRFALEPDHFVFFPSFLPTYVIGVRGYELSSK